MPAILEPAELRSRGFEALVKALSWVNAVRIIQQFERSGLNYTAERDALLPELGTGELIDRLNAVGSSGK